MMNIRVICVGKLKEKYLREACAEYTKRLGAFCYIEVIELSESRLGENPSDKEKLNALTIEGKEIIRNIKGYSFALCIEGKQMESEALSGLVDNIGVSGQSCISFIIGSSYGLSEEVKNHCDFRLSMSKMTFPHQLARVMLFEQIYRAFQISNGGKYHK